MESRKLFQDHNGNWLTNLDLLNVLKEIGADQCDTLFIHTSLTFGTPNPELKKKELLNELLNVIKELNVRNVCMPTYTFSFCNGKNYNPAKSVSRMGALNEFFRKQEGVVRSVDPLMSVAMLGEDKELVLEIGHSSCGNNSTYDKLRHRDGVKFLFLGAKIGDCFTYMHYLEWLYGVDYRYERKFRGEVVIDGVSSIEEYDLFCRYDGVIPNTNSYVYEQEMYEKGEAQVREFGDSTISIVEQKTASKAYQRCLLKDPHYFVDFRDGAFIKDKTFIVNGEMVAM